MHIAILSSSFAGGGAEPISLRWADALNRFGHSVLLMPYLHAAVPTGYNVEAFPGVSTVDRWTRLPRWVAEVCAARGVELILSVLTFSNITALRAAALHSARLSVVITEHNILSTMMAMEGVTGTVKSALARRFYRHADGVIAVSHAGAADLVGGYGVSSGKVYVLPNAVFDASPAVPTRRLSHPRPGPLRLIFVGRLVPQKSPLTFLYLLKELASRGLAVEGVIVGDGVLRAQLESLTKVMGVTCRFTGWKQDWADVADGAHCLVLPSHVEGFGNVLVEAAALGIPAVASSQALGVSDALIPGVTGQLALSSRVVDIADAVESAVAIGPILPPAGWLSRFSGHSSGADLNRIVTHAAEPRVNRTQPRRVGGLRVRWQQGCAYADVAASNQTTAV